MTTQSDIRRRARLFLIIRASPRDGDGDGYYSPFKGAPDRTPLPPRILRRPTREPDFDGAVRSGVKEREPLSGGQMARTTLVHYNDGTDLVEKRMRDASADASAAQQAEAEHLAGVLGRAIGAPVPETRLRDNDTVLMSVVPGRTELARYLAAEKGGNLPAHERIRQSAVDSDTGRLLGVLDLLMDNDDRNSGNWLIDGEGNPHGIDHALSWAPQHVYSGRPDLSIRRDEGGDGYVVVGPDGPLPGTYPDEYEAQDAVDYWWLLDGLDLSPAGGEPPSYDKDTLSPFASAFVQPIRGTGSQWTANDLAPADMAWLRSRLETVRGQFEALDRLDWYEFALQRLDAIGRHARGSRVRWAT